MQGIRGVISTLASDGREIMGPGILLNERGQSLVDTCYRIMGYRSNASGAWMAS